MAERTIFDAMQLDEPFAVYVKTVPSQVQVILMNPFSSEPEAVILTGQNGGDPSLAKTWTLQEDMFFKRMNKSVIEQGLVIPFKSKKAVEEVVNPINQLSDTEIDEIVNGKFFTLQNAMNKTESEATIFRMLESARRQEKSEKIIQAITARLAEVQNLGIKLQEEE